MFMWDIYPLNSFQSIETNGQNVQKFKCIQLWQLLLKTAPMTTVLIAYTPNYIRMFT